MLISLKWLVLSTTQKQNPHPPSSSHFSKQIESHNSKYHSTHHQLGWHFDNSQLSLSKGKKSESVPLSLQTAPRLPQLLGQLQSIPLHAASPVQPLDQIPSFSLVWRGVAWQNSMALSRSRDECRFQTPISITHCGISWATFSQLGSLGQKPIRDLPHQGPRAW